MGGCNEDGVTDFFQWCPMTEKRQWEKLEKQDIMSVHKKTLLS